MKYRPKISRGDFDTKTRKVEKFLADGHKVKVTLTFRGREVYHPELGKKILDDVVERSSTSPGRDRAPLDGRNMTMVLAPDKRAQAAAQRQARQEAAEAEPPGDGTGGAAAG
jgi:translation initiation factor IF-3